MERWREKFCKIISLGTQRCTGLRVLVTPAVYSHLYDLTGNLIFALKVDPLNLEFQNKIKKFLWLARVPQSKFEANRSMDSLVMIRQTNRQTAIRTLYIDSLTGVINSLLETFYIIDYKNKVNQNSKSTLLSIGLILSHFNKYRCKSHIHITLYIICNLTMLINYYLKPISPYYYMYYDLA